VAEGKRGGRGGRGGGEAAHVDGPRGVHACADNEAERAEGLHGEPLDVVRQQAVLARLVPHPCGNGDGGEEVQQTSEHHDLGRRRG